MYQIHQELAKKIASKLQLPETVVYLLIEHQWKSTVDAMGDLNNQSIEITGLATLNLRPLEIERSIKREERLRDQAIKNLKQGKSPRTWRYNRDKAIKTIELLKTRLDGLQANTGGVKEPLTSGGDDEGVD